MSAFNENNHPRDPLGKFRDKPGTNTSGSVALASQSKWGNLETLQNTDESVLHRDCAKTWADEDEPSRWVYVMPDGAQVTVDQDDPEWLNVSFEDGNEMYEVQETWEGTTRSYTDNDESISAYIDGEDVTVAFMTEGGVIESNGYHLAYTTPLDNHMRDVTYTKEGTHWLANDGRTEVEVDEAEVNKVFAANHNTDFTVEDMADEYTRRVAG